MRFPKLKKDKRELTKTVVDAVTDYGTTMLLYHVIENNVVKPRRLHNKIALAVFSFAVGSAISELGKKHTDKVIDTIFDTFAEVQKAVEENRLEKHD